jgi:hypothetical protein
MFSMSQRNKIILLMRALGVRPPGYPQVLNALEN